MKGALGEVVSSSSLLRLALPAHLPQLGTHRDRQLVCLSFFIWHQGPSPHSYCTSEPPWQLPVVTGMMKTPHTGGTFKTVGKLLAYSKQLLQSARGTRVLALLWADSSDQIYGHPKAAQAQRRPGHPWQIIFALRAPSAPQHITCYGAAKITRLRAVAMGARASGCTSWAHLVLLPTPPS